MAHPMRLSEPSTVPSTKYCTYRMYDTGEEASQCRATPIRAWLP